MCVKLRSPEPVHKPIGYCPLDHRTIARGRDGTQWNIVSYFYVVFRHFENKTIKFKYVLFYSINNGVVAPNYNREFYRTWSLMGARATVLALAMALLCALALAHTFICTCICFAIRVITLISLRYAYAHKGNENQHWNRSHRNERLLMLTGHGWK